MSTSDISITVSVGATERGAREFVLKIQADLLELNVWIPEGELSMLNRVQDASWNSRGSLRIGSAANSAVFWSSTQSVLSILVGQDDETWDVALRLPIAALHRIISEVEAEQAAAADRSKSRSG
jgi:hypothetical protein